MWKFQTLCIQFSLKIDQQLGNRKRKFFLMVVTINVKKNITMYKYNWRIWYVDELSSWSVNWLEISLKWDSGAKV